MCLAGNKSRPADKLIIWLHLAASELCCKRVFLVSKHPSEVKDDHITKAENTWCFQIIEISVSDGYMSTKLNLPPSPTLETVCTSVPSLHLQPQRNSEKYWIKELLCLLFHTSLCKVSSVSSLLPYIHQPSTESLLKEKLKRKETWKTRCRPLNLDDTLQQISSQMEKNQLNALLSWTAHNR